MTNTDTRPMLTSAQVMELLSIKQTKFYQLVDSGELKPVAIPTGTGQRREFRFEQSEIDDFIKRNKRTPAAS
jgi:excisionase family DNA binding protein